MNKQIIYTGILGIYYGKLEAMATFKQYNSTINLSIGANIIVTTLTRQPRVIELFNTNNEQITAGVSIDYDFSGGVYRILIDTSVALTNCQLNVISW